MCGGPAWKREVVPDHKVPLAVKALCLRRGWLLRNNCSLTLSTRESSPTMASLCAWSMWFILFYQKKASTESCPPGRSVLCFALRADLRKLLSWWPNWTSTSIFYPSPIVVSDLCFPIAQIPMDLPRGPQVIPCLCFRYFLSHHDVNHK
jgi:hypothetical protein